MNLLFYKLIVFCNILLITGCSLHPELKLRQLIGYSKEKFLSIYIPDHLPFKSVAQDNFDVIEQKLSIKIDPSKRYIYGETVLIISAQISEKEFYLNFSDKLNIISAKIDNNTVPFIHKDNLLFIKSEKLNRKDSLFSLNIIYKGIPEKRRLKGLVFGNGKSGPYCFSSNEANFAQDWFPCKDIPSDKFKSELSIITPAPFFAISNGKLISQQDLKHNNFKYTYKSDYPISTYLVAFSIGKYEINKDSIKNIHDEYIPFNIYFYPELKSSIERINIQTKHQMEYLERTIDKYPFVKDGYNIVSVYDYFGGMENQTITFIGSQFFSQFDFYDNLFLHEMIHSWFGNSVTLADWNDIWLNESLTEFLTVHYFDNLNDLKGEKSGFVKFIDRIYSGSIYSPKINLFSDAVYKKGAFVLRMLLNELGDSVFFFSIKSYYNSFMFRNARTTNLIDIFEKYSKKNLKTFFQQWIFSDCERPVINIDYQFSFQNRVSNIYLMIEQIQNCNLYELNLPLRIFYKDTSETTILKIKKRTEEFTIIKPFLIDSISFDPDKTILMKFTINKK